MTKYKFSTDYKRLVELMKQGVEVFCEVDYAKIHRDAATTLYDKEFPNIYQISARGICYVWARNEQQFIERCNQYNVRFIDPSDQIKGRCGVCKRGSIATKTEEVYCCFNGYIRHKKDYCSFFESKEPIEKEVEND